MIKRFLEGAIAKIRKTAMGPGLWLVGIVGALALPTVCGLWAMGAKALAIGVAVLFAFVVVVVTLVFVGFAFWDRDRLQTSAYLDCDSSISKEPKDSMN